MRAPDGAMIRAGDEAMQYLELARIRGKAYRGGISELVISPSAVRFE